MLAIDRLTVLGTPVDTVDMENALEFIDYYVHTASQPGCVLAVNPEKVYAVRSNPFLEEFFSKAILLLPDGIGVVIALRLLYGKRVSRVTGADLMQRICSQSSESGHRIFIFGGTDQVNKAAVAELRRRYAGINIVGRAHGYISADQTEDLIRKINDSKPDILFVALSTPKQEKWIQEHLPNLKVKICQGIGGTLDTIVGNVKRAPRAFQNLGLEWLYRLIQQPSRIRRQYKYFLFVWELLFTKLGIR